MMRARQKMMMKMATMKKEMRSIVGCRMWNIVAR